MGTTNQNLKNVSIIILGALLMGFLWRIRGEHGWGSSWGLLNAGFVFTLFIVTVTGAVKKFNNGFIALTALSFMLTTPGWGTLLHQISGVIYRPEDWSDGGDFVYTSVGSAVFLMLCLGFGLASIFGIMLGRGFSSTQWKFKHIVILLGVFYATDLIANAFISPFLLNVIQPEAAEIFEKGLQLQDFEPDAYKIYMKHFLDISWAKKIDGGRNYFQSIQAITSAIKALAVILSARFIIKDKIAAKTGAVVCGAFAFAITISDLFFYFGNGGYHMAKSYTLPEIVYPWGCWEYFTGFIAGGIITAFILKLKTENIEQDLIFSKIPSKANNVFSFVAGTVFMIGVNIVRPVLVRYEDSDYMILATIIAVIFAVAVILMFVKGYGVNASKSTTPNYTSLLLLFFVAYINVVYLLIGTPDCIHLFGNYGLQHFLAVLSAVILIIYFSVLKSKKLNKEV